jgi:hypothetical protein
MHLDRKHFSSFTINDWKDTDMNAPKDDLEAVRAVVDAIKDFKSDEQQRIFRWVAEKLGLPQPFASSVHVVPPPSATPGVTQPAPPSAPPVPAGTKDIKTFIAEKDPKKDVQVAAVVAYYYRFEAPPAERKDAINKEDLQEAMRLAGRPRFNNPLQTLANAHIVGLLDRGSEKATFTLNSVGENLVAMTLPGTGSAVLRPKRAKKGAVKKVLTKKAKRA